MIIHRFNKVSEGQYIGETMWRSRKPFGSSLGGKLLGWFPYAMSLESENVFSIITTPPPGLTVTKVVGAFGHRIGEPPKRPRQIAGSGTGFFVSSDGLIVTNHHVIDGAKTISVSVPSGKTYTAKVVSQSASTDLAVLKIQYTTKNYLTFADPGAAEIGDDVFTLGFPVSDILGKEVKYSEGVINSLSGIKGDATFFQISVPIQPGNSGGPLVNADGDVVGIVTSTAAVKEFYQATGSMPQNINWAVKGAYASLILPSRVQKGRRQADNPVKNTKKSVVFIEVK
jgi:S1-C subfamily serine protease